MKTLNSLYFEAYYISVSLPIIKKTSTDLLFTHLYLQESVVATVQETVSILLLVYPGQNVRGTLLTNVLHFEGNKIL